MSAISASNGSGGPGAGAAVAAVPAVALVRYRPGVVGETARTVHVVPLPTDRHAGAVGALCGAALMLGDIETVNPGEGMPCIVCVVTHVTGTALAGEPPAASPDGAGVGLAAGGACYQQWGWPVTLHRDQVRLSLYGDVAALAIPIPFSTDVTEILTRRRCVPPVLAHPYTPDHHILLTGERYGVTLAPHLAIDDVTVREVWGGGLLHCAELPLGATSRPKLRSLRAGMTPDHMAQLIDAHVSAEKTGDLDAAVAVYTEDIEHDVVGAPGGPTRGVAAARSRYEPGRTSGSTAPPSWPSSTRPCSTPRWRPPRPNR